MPLLDAYLGKADPSLVGNTDYRGGITGQINGPNFINLRRPYYDKHGRASVTVNTGRTTLVKGMQVPIKEHRLIRDLTNRGILSPVFNATTLRKEEWALLDTRIVR